MSSISAFTRVFNALWRMMRRIRPLVGTPFESFETTGPSTHLDKVRLLSPVAPRNFYGVGLNYVKHAQEVKQPLPAVPMLFMKPTSAVIGPEAPILYPSAKAEKNVHFEAEVAVVIGRTARRTGEARRSRPISIPATSPSWAASTVRRARTPTPTTSSIRSAGSSPI